MPWAMDYGWECLDHYCEVWAEHIANARMIERDGAPKPVPVAEAATPTSTAKPAVAALLIDHFRGHIDGHE